MFDGCVVINSVFMKDWPGLGFVLPRIKRNQEFRWQELRTNISVLGCEKLMQLELYLTLSPDKMRG